MNFGSPAGRRGKSLRLRDEVTGEKGGKSGPVKVRIEGNVSILFRSGFAFSGSAGFVLAPGAKLTVYTGGDTFIAGSGFGNSGNPTQLTIYGLGGCTLMYCSGNGGFCGLI